MEILNDTGLKYYPHYLNVGDALMSDIEYDAAALEDLDFGDLEEVVSKKEMVQLTTDSVSHTKPDREILLGAVESAESEFDAYASVRYTIPLRTLGGYIPREAKAKSKLLFRYFLYSRRPNIPRDVEKAYNDVMTFLVNLSKNLATIPQLDVSDTGQVTNITPVRTTIGVVHRGTDLFGSRRASTDVRHRRTGFDYPGDEYY